jgi:paraquat-inducible protein A
MCGGRRSFLLGLMIVGASVCLVLGLTLPIMRLTRFYIWTDVHSLISVVRELYNSGEIFLAAIICIFSVIFPFFKLLYLLALYSIRQVHPGSPGILLKRMAWLGKWSMLDVLVLALLIFYAKSTNLADATSMPGIYMFAAAVILTMIANSMVEQDLSRDEKRDGANLGRERRERRQLSDDVRPPPFQPLLESLRHEPRALSAKMHPPVKTGLPAHDRPSAS